jgi:amino acid transporter
MENPDIEKGSVSDVKDHASASPSYSTSAGGEPNYEETTIIQQNFGRRLFDSFKRDPRRTATPIGVIGANGRVYDGKGAAKATAASPLARRLKGRHLQMIAIGGSIGETVSGILWLGSNNA